MLFEDRLHPRIRDLEVVQYLRTLRDAVEATLII